MPARCAPRPTAPGSPTPPRCSSRSPGCAATGAGTAPSPTRRARCAAPYLDARRGAGHRPGRRRAGCHEALFTLGERPELRYPVAARLAAPSTATHSTVDYLVAMCRAGGRARPGCCRTPTPARCSADELAALRPVARQPGDDDRVAATPTSTATAAPRTRRPRAGWPPSRRPASWRSRSPPGSSSASASPRQDRLDALRAIAASHARHGHVQEVIVQNFLPKPRHARCAGRAAVPDRRLPRAIAAGPADPAARRAPPGPAEPHRRRRSGRCSTPASTTGAGSRRSPPTTSTRSARGPASTCCARSPRPTASPWRRG